VTGRLAELLTGFADPVPAILDTQTHRRDRTRNLPTALRNLVLRRWGRNIFHANYRPLLELP
jgi:hypothetical protein